MATWKKVIVSGSAAELLNVTASAANITTLNVTAGSGSFSGSFQGDGSGLTNVPASGIVLAVLSQSLGIENFSYTGQTSATVQLATGSAHFIQGARQTINVSDTTGATGINLSYNEAAGTISGSLLDATTKLGNTTLTLQATASTVDGLTLTNVVATGSFSGSFVGTTNLPDLTAGTGISTFTYDGATTATVSVSGASTLSSDKISKWTGTAFANSSLTDNGTEVFGSSSIQLVGASSSLTGSFSGSFTGDGSGLNNLVSNLNFSGSTGTGTVDLKTQAFTIAGTNNEIVTSAANQTITISLPDDVVIGQDLRVSRNLTVLGTASFQNTTNLDVADRFILLASGSNTAGDGGIVIQDSGTQGIGEGFGYDSAVTRWGVTGSFDGSQATFTPDAFMAAVVVSSSLNPNDAPARYDKEGNIYVSSGDGSIYIYS
jgi:hypothetical protein